MGKKKRILSSCFLFVTRPRPGQTSFMFGIGRTGSEGPALPALSYIDATSGGNVAVAIEQDTKLTMASDADRHLLLADSSIATMPRLHQWIPVPGERLQSCATAGSRHWRRQEKRNQAAAAPDNHWDSCLEIRRCVEKNNVVRGKKTALRTSVRTDSVRSYDSNPVRQGALSWGAQARRAPRASCGSCKATVSQRPGHATACIIRT